MSKDKVASSMEFIEKDGVIACIDYDWVNSVDGAYFGTIGRLKSVDGYYYYLPQEGICMTCQQAKAIYLKLQELNRALKEEE